MTDAPDFTETPQFDGGEQEAPATETQAPTGDNPAWKEFQDQLDPMSYSRVKPLLSKWDQGVTQKMSQASEQYAPYKDIIAGRDPKTLELALRYADALDQNPVQVFQQMQNWLTSQGMLEQQQYDEEQESEDGEQEDPRFAQLQQQQEQMRDFLAQQHQAQIDSQADADLNRESAALKQAHPDLSDEDMQEVYRRAAFAAQQGGKVPTLEQAYTEFSALRDRIRSMPRPGDSAPNLVPLNGGTPSPQSQRSLGSLSREESQNMLAALIEADNRNNR